MRNGAARRAGCGSSISNFRTWLSTSRASAPRRLTASRTSASSAGSRLLFGDSVNDAVPEDVCPHKTLRILPVDQAVVDEATEQGDRAPPLHSDLLTAGELAADRLSRREEEDQGSLTVALLRQAGRILNSGLGLGQGPRRRGFRFRRGDEPDLPTGQRLTTCAIRLTCSAPSELGASFTSTIKFSSPQRPGVGAAIRPARGRSCAPSSSSRSASSYFKPEPVRYAT